MSDLSEPAKKILKSVLALTIASSSFAVQVFLPALPAVQKQFGVSAAVVQLTVSLPLIALAVSTLMWGILSDRYGRRPTMLAGLALFLIGTLACAVAPTIELLIAGRLVQAVGGAACVVISRAIVRDIYGRERAAAELASLIAIMVIGPMLAPIIGGVLVDTVGWRGSFEFIAVFLAGVLAYAGFRLAETNHQRLPIPDLTGIFLAYGRLVRSSDFMAYALQSAFMIGTFYVVLSAAPYAIITVMGYSATEYGLGFILSTVGYLSGNLIAQRYSQRVGIDRMIALALATALISTFATVALLMAGVWTLLAVFVPLTFMGIANGMSLPNANAGAVSVYPEMAGTASGLLSFLQNGIAALFAQVTGSVQDGTPHAFGLGMFVAAVLAVVSFYGPVRHKTLN
ncbi:MAG: multidrug effflux MFS transporter [Rhodospirillaceae bacterium]|nr:multidrug effflux MFS transporter [Rhodospirillaceae bacterium]